MVTSIEKVSLAQSCAPTSLGWWTHTLLDSISMVGTLNRDRRLHVLYGRSTCYQIDWIVYHYISETLYWLNLLSGDNKSPSDQTSRLLHFTRDSLVLLKHSLKGPKVCTSSKTEALSLANAPWRPRAVEHEFWTNSVH